MALDCELTLEKEMGRLRRVVDSRGGITCRSPGDKNYRSPEYSDGFFKQVKQNDTIYFRIIPVSASSPGSWYRERGRRNQKSCLSDEIQSVIDLDQWKPAKKLSRKLKCIDYF